MEELKSFYERGWGSMLIIDYLRLLIKRQININREKYFNLNRWINNRKKKRRKRLYKKEVVYQNVWL